MRADASHRFRGHDRKGIVPEVSMRMEPRVRAAARLQTVNDSPQPQRPFSFGFLNVKPVWNLSST